MLIATFKAGPPVAVKGSPGHPLARALAGGWLFNEGAGRTVHDGSGHGAHGSFSGEPTWTAGRFGGAIEFGGYNDWLDMGDRLDQGTDDITVCAIVKYSASSQPDDWFGTRLGAIAGKGHQDYYGKGYGLCVDTDNKICWEVHDQSTGYTVTSDSALNDGRCHTVIGVCDRDSSTGLRLYVDGLRQSATADPTAIAGHDLSGSRAFAVGSRQEENNGTWYWDFEGSIACVYVWRRVLRSAEINALQRDPFALFAPRRSSAVLSAPAGRIVELAGSTTGHSTTAATVRLARNLSGTAGATASLSSGLRTVKTLSGTCTEQTGLSGALRTTHLLSLSGTANALSKLTGLLRVPLPEPLFAGEPEVKAFWRREALFNGATAPAFKLGTVLTQGWFWVRRTGCAAVYRGPSMAQVDFNNILCVTDPDAKHVPLPAYLSHDPMSRRYYVIRRFNGGGEHERTTAAAVAVRIGLNGRIVKPGPNGIFSLDCRPTVDGRVCLVWFYCPLNQHAEPEQFRIYRSDSAGSIDFEDPLAAVPYVGRRFYRYCTDIPEEGQYRFAVKAVSTDGVESTSPPSATCQSKHLPPETPTILAVQPV
ncbi:MAG: LamG domain-containing protein [Sedimentisphaerales bacterium]|nr:LamG domain-containing protein [Sedimentisphaerales bacterium]